MPMCVRVCTIVCMCSRVFACVYYELRSYGIIHSIVHGRGNAEQLENASTTAESTLDETDFVLVVSQCKGSSQVAVDSRPSNVPIKI